MNRLKTCLLHISVVLLWVTSTLLGQGSYPIDSHATYLAVDDDPDVFAATPLTLSELGIAPGDTITLVGSGQVSYCQYGDPPCPEVFPSMAGLFSSTLSPAGAIVVSDAPEIFTPPTLFGEIPTDIPEDFWVAGFPGTTVVVPQGALYLFVIMVDSWYGDNSVGNLAVQIQQSPCPPPSEGPNCLPLGDPLSWWTGDGTAGDIMNRNDGTLITTYGTGPDFGSGMVDAAFDFAGNGYVNVPTSDSLNFGTGDFTVEFWVRFNSLGNNSNGMVSKDSWTGNLSTATGWLFNICDQCAVVDGSVGTPGIGLTTRRRSAGLAADARWATSNFATNRWYHIAGVRQSNILYLYVDGILRAETPEPSPIDVSNSTDLTIGGLNASYFTQPLNGKLDEVTVYGHALSPMEIESIFLAEKAGKCRPEVIFDGMTGTFTLRYPSMDNIEVSVPFTVGDGPEVTVDWWRNIAWRADIGGDTITLNMNDNYCCTSGSTFSGPVIEFDDPSFQGIPGVRLIATNIADFDTSRIEYTAKSIAVNINNGLDLQNDRYIVLSVSPLPLISGLTAWWTGEGNAEDVVGSHDGTLIPDIGLPDLQFESGVVGEAFRFDGSQQFVQIPPSPLWNLSKDFTLSLWAQFSGINEESPNVFLGCDQGGGEYNKWIFLYVEGGLSFHINGWIDGIQHTTLVDPVLFVPQTGEWYHLALTRESDRFSFYVNGTLLDIRYDSTPIPPPSTRLTIGQAEELGFFDGALDEVQIYDRVLSAAEIENLATNPPAYIRVGTDVTARTASLGAQPTMATLQFSEVTRPGTLTVSSVTGDIPQLPDGLSLGSPPSIWEISTTAEYSGPIAVCLDYSEITFQYPDALSMLHFCPSGGWEAVGSQVIPDEQKVCGTVLSLGQFALVEPPDMVAPVVSNVSVSPAAIPLNGSAVLSADLHDEGGSGLGSAEISINGGNPVSMGPVSGNDASVISEVGPFQSTGVFEVCVQAQDLASNLSAPECVLLPVYDPNAGFVTGGGWILSPAGAYLPDPATTGKATFGFVSRYRKGANVPSGDTQFQFHSAHLDFKSSAYEWLVIAGARAQFKGVGTINGTGNYGFLLTAVDGQVPGGGGTDKFRIKIWDIPSGSIVYDNQAGDHDGAQLSTALGGGSIVIHP